jgi:pilus assembly protein CpaE
MVLSLRRDPGGADVEAYVFAEGFAEMEALSTGLDAEFGRDGWRLVEASSAARVLRGPETDGAIAIVAIATDASDEVEAAAQLIRRARHAKMPVLLVTGDLSSRTVHHLIREGVSEFTPFPDPDGALHEAVTRVRLLRAGGTTGWGPGATGQARRGRLITAYGVAGGVGASTFVVNLAWEIAATVRRQGQRVALLDFNFQYGSVATYLDVARREAVYELVSEAASLDQTGLTQALSVYQDRLHVLTAPRDALPLDIVSPDDVTAIISLAREAFDYVLIDMPQALMNWSEQVYNASDEFYALMEVDMRSAQNMFRFLRTLKAEDMALDKIRFVLNRAPGLTDLGGKQRMRRVAESLGIEYAYQLPDGGRQVVNACDQGVPLAEAVKSNPLRREVARIAQAIVAAGHSTATAAQ